MTFPVILLETVLYFAYLQYFDFGLKILNYCIFSKEMHDAVFLFWEIENHYQYLYFQTFI